jgi:hypothetical protein
MKIALVVFSTLFLTSQMHTLIYTFSESYDSELNKLELIKKFNLTSLNALSTITVSILASLVIYYGLTQTLPSLGMNLTPNIVSGIISLSLFCGIYIAEFYPWKKNRSMFTSVMFFLVPEGMNVYENSLNKNLFLLGLLFTQNGGISHIRSWGSGIVISYKYDQKMLVFAFPGRADFDDWCFDADEVSSSCSICGEFDGKCLKLEEKGYVVGSESEDTDVLCTCKDCKDDILKAGVNSGDVDEEDILKNRI